MNGRDRGEGGRQGKNIMNGIDRGEGGGGEAGQEYHEWKRHRKGGGGAGQEII